MRYFASDNVHLVAMSDDKSIAYSWNTKVQRWFKVNPDTILKDHRSPEIDEDTAFKMSVVFGADLDLAGSLVNSKTKTDQI